MSEFIFVDMNDPPVEPETQDDPVSLTTDDVVAAEVIEFSHMEGDLGTENVQMDPDVVGQSNGVELNAENDDGVEEDVLINPEFIESDPDEPYLPKDDVEATRKWVGINESHVDEETKNPLDSSDYDTEELVTASFDFKDGEFRRKGRWRKKQKSTGGHSKSCFLCWVSFSYWSEIEGGHQRVCCQTP